MTHANKTSDLSGSIVPLITPLLQNEDLDVAAIAKLVSFHQENGTKALFLLGTCGEGPCLTDPMKELLIDSVIAQNSDLPVLVGVTDMATRRAVIWAQKAARPGVSALVIMPPVFQFATTAAEHLAHVKAIADAVDIPLILYNLPKKCGNQAVALQAVHALAADGIVSGIKDSSGDLDYIAALLKIRESFPNFHVVNGELRTAKQALEMGADGLVMSYTNIAPDECVELMNAVRSGNIDRAAQLQEKFVAHWNTFPTEYSPAAKVKSILAARGLCKGYCCAPATNLA
ncbi:MAG: dihydrodipicolinate synthase family protein [Phycisphaeraceae bacterium]|nr:dihydrodipicolinate synthase family protein [Phycisphaeraceae bacterium]